MFFLCPWFSFACQSCPRGDYLQDSDDWVEAPPTTGSVDKAWKVTGQAQTASSSTNSAQVSKSCLHEYVCVCERVLVESVGTFTCIRRLTFGSSAERRVDDL